MKYLDNISDADIAKLELPAGVPLMYEFDTDLNPISRHYLAQQSLVAQADSTSPARFIARWPADCIIGSACCPFHEYSCRSIFRNVL